MRIHLTNQGSAKLLGINPACYTDNRLRQLNLISQSCSMAMGTLEEDDDRISDLLAAKIKADDAYEERWVELREACER